MHFQLRLQSIFILILDLHLQGRVFLVIIIPAMAAHRVTFSARIGPILVARMILRTVLSLSIAIHAKAVFVKLWMMMIRQYNGKLIVIICSSVARTM